MTASLLPLARHALVVAWPAFGMACVAEMLLFAVVDPLSLTWFGGETFDWSRQAVYTVTFFILWGLIAAAGAITLVLARDGD